MMLTNEDMHWLKNSHPMLIPSANGAAGSIEFNATYNSHTDRFLVLSDGMVDAIDGVTLSVSFRIRIEARSEITFSALPAVYVDGVEPSKERHFGQKDKSACLCSPFIENEYLRPDLQFRAFVEELVIPFLYGQAFFTATQRWPWGEYAHGATGVLEAYSHTAGRISVGECLSLLQRNKEWPKVKAALLQERFVKGHTPCFCEKMDQIRRCHPDALRGALQLQRDIKASGGWRILVQPSKP